LDFPAHFDGRRYFNPGGAPLRGLGSALKWMLRRRQDHSPPLERPRNVPVWTGREAAPTVTVVNHTTALLELRGVTILTDPIWSERCSPVSFAGPRRKRPPGIPFNKLPRIDVVLVTHNHYDHLDLPTLRRLRPKLFVAPVGVGRFLEGKGIGPVRELDWGASAPVNGGVVHATPAFHFSGRGVFDRDTTLWCSYMIDSADGLIFFGGDTGFGQHFSWIRERFGAPRAALLPIGAYKPRWFMSPVHMNPAEAAEAHRILGAQLSIAIHNGTFQLADEGIDQPRRELGDVAGFVVPWNGEPVTLA
jgi:L-ascorbate metabolism protein UlaG (beta-lactamase superfamily)